MLQENKRSVLKSMHQCWLNTMLCNLLLLLLLLFHPNCGYGFECECKCKCDFECECKRKFPQWFILWSDQMMVIVDVDLLRQQQEIFGVRQLDINATQVNQLGLMLRNSKISSSACQIQPQQQVHIFVKNHKGAHFCLSKSI